jgi:hypothetical protein
MRPVATCQSIAVNLVLPDGITGAMNWASEVGRGDDSSPRAQPQVQYPLSMLGLPPLEWGCSKSFKGSDRFLAAHNWILIDRRCLETNGCST